MSQCRMAGWAVGILCAGAAAGVWAAEATISADLASAYVFRGATLNDGPVIQPCVEVSHKDLSACVWANYDLDDYDGQLEDNEFSEVDLNVWYTLPIEAVETSVGYREYTYPTADVNADREFALFGAADCLLSPSLELGVGVGGAIHRDLYAEFGLSHEQELAEKLTATAGASVGYLQADKGGDGFSNYRLSLGATYDVLTASIAYIGQLDDEVLPDAKDGSGYDVEWVGTLGVSLDF